MKAFILLLLFCLTLEQIELHQNSSISISHCESINFYLSLNGFKSGDDVEIKCKYYYTKSYENTPKIKYRQSNSISTNEFASNFTDISHYWSIISDNKITSYYTIKLDGNYSYLLFKFTGSYGIEYTIKHGNDSPAWTIIVCVSTFVSLVGIAITLYWYRRNRNKPDHASRIDDPLVSSYPEVQPQPQTPVYVQPTYQPYDVQQNGYANIIN